MFPLLLARHIRHGAQRIGRALSTKHQASETNPMMARRRCGGWYERCPRFSFALAALCRVQGYGRGNKPRKNTFVADKQRKELLAASGDFGAALDVGGATPIMNALFRRVFASRLVPPAVAQKLGLRHARGLLLHGPPGTGKSLIARNLAAVLSAKPPKLVHGPEIFSHLLGSSEQALRDLFKNADNDWKRLGSNSPLHVIVFDEIDAVLRRRGGPVEGGAAARDAVVNQLLSKVDGLAGGQDNVLVVGTTNRLDLVDEAALRPGRLEVHVELPLPDAKGREEILRIHTRELEANGALAADVLAGDDGAGGGGGGGGGVLRELARHRTANFTGAELEGIANNAATFALTRYLQQQEARGGDDDGDLEAAFADDVEVNADDFRRAAEEMTPMFGGAGGAAGAVRSVAGAGDADAPESDGSAVPRRSSPAHDACRAVAARVAGEGPGSSASCLLLGGRAGCGPTRVALDVLASSGGSASSDPFPFQRVVDAAEFLKTDVERARLALCGHFADARRSPAGAALVLRDVDLLPSALRPALRALLRQRGGGAAGARLLVLATAGSAGLGEGELEDVTAMFEEIVDL